MSISNKIYQDKELRGNILSGYEIKEGGCRIPKYLLCTP